MHPALKLIGFAIAPLVLSMPIAVLMGDRDRSAIAQGMKGNLKSAKDLVDFRSKYIGVAEPKIEMLRAADLGIQAVQTAFQTAQWQFYPDGRFVFIPSQPKTAIEQRLFIVGTYKKIGDRLEFQGEQLQGYGLSISVDGTVHQENNKLVLNATYTSSAINLQQIARVSQSLLPNNQSGDLIDPKRLITTSKLDLKTEKQAQSLPDVTLQPIAGIIPGVYDVYLEGKTEFAPFEGIPAQIFVIGLANNFKLSLDEIRAMGLEVEKDRKSMKLLTEGGITEFSISSSDRSRNGSLSLDSGIERPFQMEKTEIKNGQIFFTLKSNQLSQSVNWMTVPKSAKPNEVVRVFVEDATLMLTFKGDDVSGEVKASGLYTQLDKQIYNQPSSYYAKIKGSRQKSELTDQLRKTLSTSSFTGRWTTTIGGLGQIELQQVGRQVSGTYTGYGGGTIQGIMQGNRLDLSWIDKQRGQGSGVLRAIAGGGTVVGNLGTLTKLNQETVIANWQAPSKFITQYLTPLDFSEIKRLSSNLVLQGRCQQASGILQKIADIYRKNREKGELEKNERGLTTLSEEIGLLAEMSICKFQSGDYDGLLNVLDQGSDVQQLLTPGETSKRNFQGLTKDVPDALKYTTTNFKNLRATLVDFQKVISFVGVGIRTQLDENKKILVVNVTPDSPAAKAGLLVNDALTKIDGQSTQGFTEEQVVQRIRGTEGTSIILTVPRGSEEKEFTITRTRIEVRPKYRSTEEFKRDVDFLINYLDRAQNDLAVTLNKLNTLENQIGLGKIDPVSALDTLIVEIDRLQKQFAIDHTPIAAQSQALLTGKENEELLSIQNIGIAMTKPARCEAKKAEIKDWDMKWNNTLDEKFENLLKQNSVLTPQEKYLLDRQSKTLAQLSQVSLDLDCTRDLIAKVDVPRRLQLALKQSLDSSAQNINTLESWRKRLSTDVSRIQAQEQGQPFFQKLIQFLLGIGQEQQALVASENSRARAFADLISRKLTADSSQSVNQNPQQSLTLEQIQQTAKTQNSTFVQYTLSLNQILYVWVVQPNGSIQFRKADLKTLNQSLNGFVNASRNSIGARSREEADILITLSPEKQRELQEQRDRSLRQLHQLLIEPIADLLPKDPNQRVIFIPQGSLFLVPFPALQDANGKYLIEKHTILIAPSIQVLDQTHQLQQQRNRQRSLETLIVGNPTMPTVTLSPGEPPQQLPALPGAAKEAIAIAPLLNTQAIIGNQGTKAAIVQKMSNARIIHLATHGILDDLRGIGSAIALAPDPGKPPQDELGRANGLLTAEEVLDMKLNAELVVLSACDTGRGKITGDGVIGLSRSFISAGVPSIIVSLWSVPDAPTAELMTEFYKNWQVKKLDKAQSLRQAMLSIMKDHPNPRDWAAFTLIGEAE